MEEPKSKKKKYPKIINGRGCRRSPCVVFLGSKGHDAWGLNTPMYQLTSFVRRKLSPISTYNLHKKMTTKGSHVPKFGNWDAENVPYTAYFENARKAGKGGKMINPNDPEENPEAFGHGGYEDASINVSPARTRLVERPDQYNEGQKNHVHRRNPSGSGQSKSIGLKGSTLESFGNDQSSMSGFSVDQPIHHRRSSDLKKNKNDRGNSFIPRSPNRLKKSRNPSDDLSYSSASVPKFGAWDEKDPKSGEGFTVIFNKVKEEKQIAASKFPIMQPQQSMPSSDERKRHAKPKVFCCLF